MYYINRFHSSGFVYRQILFDICPIYGVFPHLSSFLYYCTEKEFLCIHSADMFLLELLQICFWNFGMLLKF